MAISLDKTEFQTPLDVCNLMASYLPSDAGTILEPTPGLGNLVSVLRNKGQVTYPENFSNIPIKSRFDWIVANPPFTPMKEGYRILYQCMEMSNNLVFLMPWLTLINGAKRSHDLVSFGLRSVTHLPRNVFEGARVQCCIIELRKHFRGDTILRFHERTR
jgi:hypothetical protein